jgi:hypothetical protein
VRLLVHRVLNATLLASLLAIVGCSTNPAQATSTTPSLVISCPMTRLTPLQRTPCAATYTAADGTHEDVTVYSAWSSAIPGVAEADGNEVIAHGNGVTSVTATFQGATASTMITVAGASDTIETFTGVLHPASANTHGFTVRLPSTISVTLTSLFPNGAISFELGLNPVLADNYCGTIVAGNSHVTAPSVVMQGTLTSIGSYCVGVGDNLNPGLTMSETYTLVVTHQ